MRFLLIIAIAVLILGTVTAYSRFQASLKVSPKSQAGAFQTSDEVRSLEIELTFDATGDLFGSESFQLWLNGVPVPAQEIQRRGIYRYDVEHLPGWRPGGNRIHLRAIGAADSSTPPRSARLQLWRRGLPRAETVFWSPAGEPVEGTWVVRDEVTEESHSDG